MPAGEIAVSAQDPLTARTGLTVGTLETEGQVLSLDIEAQGLGTVQGDVLLHDVAQPNAHVDIVSGSYRACTVTDSNGRYRIEGVPEGRVVATAFLGFGFLTGTAAETLRGDGTTLDLDVPLRDAGDVTGRVLAANGIDPAPPSVVVIRVGGPGGGELSTVTNAEGEFSFERVPSGLASITVSVLGSIDRAEVEAEVPSADTVFVPITLNGVRSIDGRAENAAGVPIGGRLVVIGTGAFRYTFILDLAKRRGLPFARGARRPIHRVSHVDGRRLHALRNRIGCARPRHERQRPGPAPAERYGDRHRAPSRRFTGGGRLRNARARQP